MCFAKEEDQDGIIVNAFMNISQIVLARKNNANKTNQETFLR
jgi:hypothetical protein